MQVPGVGEGPWDVIPADDDGQAYFGLTQLFECERSCGFESSNKTEVEAHEENCNFGCVQEATKPVEATRRSARQQSRRSYADEASDVASAGGPDETNDADSCEEVPKAQDAHDAVVPCENVAKAVGDNREEFPKESLKEDKNTVSTVGFTKDSF